VTVNGSRLRPANQARRDQRTERLADELVSRLGDMPWPMLLAVAQLVGEELTRRRADRQRRPA
jgi:hypothetical protein